MARSFTSAVALDESQPRWKYESRSHFAVTGPQAANPRLIVRQPRQQRSQDLLARLIDASRALLDERDFESISIADIAKRAGVSVGVLYTRFPTKDHLLVHLASAFGEDTAAQMARTFADERVDGLSLAELAELYFTTVGQAFTRHRRMLRSVTLLVRTTEHTELRAIVQRFNVAVHSRFAECALRHRRSLKHTDAERAINFALLAASATLREMLLYEEPVSNLARGQAAKAGRECARLFTSYLTCAER
jgi:AcrR family transcriptional regulator